MRDVGLALLLLLIATLAVSFTWRNRRELSTWLGRDPFARRRSLRACVYVFAALLLGLAWRTADRMPPELGTGAGDVVLAIDVSQSMAVTDTPPSRLRRAARIAERIADTEGGLRLGLVLFAGEPFVALPLTLDRSSVLPYTRALDTDLISRPGSDVARALGLAQTLFDPQSERARAIVLLSDGEHAGESLDPVLDRLRSEGIRVLAVGLGKPEGGIVPSVVRSSSAKASTQIRSVRRDDLLTRVTERTRGKLWREWEQRPDGAAIVAELRRSSAANAQEAESWLGVLLMACAAVWLIEWSLLQQPSAFALGARALRAVPLSALSMLLVSASNGQLGVGAGLVRQGDAELAAGRADAALRLYERAEGGGGDVRMLALRIGNAQYRLERFDHAAAQYLRALSAGSASAPDLRYRAHFNLGNAFAKLERYAEARDAFWSALLERPGDREAQFNYEWVLERIPESESGEEGEPDESGDPNAQRDATEQGGESGEEMDSAEAQRWLERLDDRVDDALRRQIERELAARGTTQPAPGGQAW